MVNPILVIPSLPEAAFASHLDLCFLYVECRIPDICVVNSLTSYFCSAVFFLLDAGYCRCSAFISELFSCFKGVMSFILEVIHIICGST